MMSVASYEIHDLTSREILSNNLSFEDMPELLQAYQDFFPNNEIIAVIRATSGKVVKLTDKDLFIIEWFKYSDEYSYNFI